MSRSAANLAIFHFTIYCSTMVSIADSVAAFPTASPPSSANAIAGNADVLTEILVRTPVKSLIRFKCVSKHWSSLISGPHFSLLHTLRNPNSKLSGLLLRKTPSLHPTTSTDESDFEFVPLNGSLSRAPPFRSLVFIHDRPSGSGTKILQSCNGLFLCCSFPHTIGTTRNYYIVNPTTKQYTVLYPHREGASTTVFGLNLAFDPSKSPHYKVICVRSAVTSSYSYQIEIYSSKSRCWRISVDSFKAPFDMVFTDGVFWNGAIHWISPSGASLRFDVDMDCLGTMPEIPVLRRDWDSRRYRFFGEFSGHLHLIEIHGPQTTQFQVFEMERDYSEWFVKYSVNLDGIVAAFPEMGRKYLDPRDGHYYAFSVLCVLHADDENESLLVLNIPGKVISYNFKDNTSKELLDFAQGKIHRRHMLQFGCFDSYQYVETLAPV